MIALFTKWKDVLVAILLALWSLGVWHVAATYTDDKFEKQKVAQANEVVKTQLANQDLSTQLAAALAQNTAELAAKHKQDMQDLLDEQAKDLRYRTCVNTDGVHDLYKRKLQTQR